MSLMRQYFRKDLTFKPKGCSQNDIPRVPSRLPPSLWFGTHNNGLTYVLHNPQFPILCRLIQSGFSTYNFGWLMGFCGELSFLDFSRFNDARFLIEQKTKARRRRFN